MLKSFAKSLMIVACAAAAVYAFSRPLPAGHGRRGVSGEPSSAPGEDGDRLCPRPPRKDMQASWIWVPESAFYDWRNSYAYFRKTFSGAGEFRIDVAADNQYQLFLDGKFLDRGTAASDTSYQIFDTWTAGLGPGDHVVAVIVHHIGQPCATAMRSRPGLFVEMTGPAGEKILSDSTWKTIPAPAYRQHLPVMMSHFGFYEVCDCRLIPAGWTDVSFDDRGWREAEVIGPAGVKPWPRMIPRDIPPLATTPLRAERIVCGGTYKPGVVDPREEDITPAVEMAARVRTKTRLDRRGSPEPPPSDTGDSGCPPVVLAPGEDNGFVILDFGREVTGHLRLSIDGAKAGQRIDVGYDEILDENGFVNPRRTYVHFADRFFLSEGQRDVEVFGARGFRYLMVDVEAGRGGLALAAARLDERTYPVKASSTASFRCSDERLDRLFETGLTTTRLCMLDAYVDCPSRERVLWTEMAVAAECGVYAFGDTDLWRRSLFLLAQNASRLPAVAGAVKGFAPCDYDPMLVSYTMYYVIMVCDYYLHGGDLRACEALFPTVMKQFEVLSRYLTPDGLVNDQWPGWGTFLDWSAMDFGGVSSCNSAIYLFMHRRTADLAEALGKRGIARDLRAKAVRIEDAYRRNFWMGGEGLFADATYGGKPSPVRSQLANVYALRAGVVRGGGARGLLEKITDRKSLLPRTPGDFRLRPEFKPQTGGLVRIGTPGLGFYLAQALFEAGMAEEALDYLREEWSPIAENGTFAEHFVSDTNTSYCHGWGAGPVVLLPRYILGIAPVAPGWTKVRIAPRAGDLEWAEGSVPSPRGPIRVSWKKVDGKLKVTYEAPAAVAVVK
ncbi:MAG: family 78 glycoside hydrolase catalytic domain [Acidobacteriota bacterium]|nr:family 78 glycoside hydrolase catalytic domain [Acidobacteriota bacterium]